MATNQPQNLSEWQLHCVLKRANLHQYYDSFIKQGECDVLKLSNAEDEKFNDVMEKVGMAKKQLHVRQFRITLLEWMEHQGKNEHVPSYLKKADDATLYPTAQSLKTTAVSDICSGLPQLGKDDVYEKPSDQNEALTTFESDKKEIQLQQNSNLKQTQRVVKDQKQHALFPYYDDLLNTTVLDKMVLDNLISRCVLMIEDREEIIKPPTQSERNKVLLDILTERPYGTIQVLKDVLQESDPHNSDVQGLVRRMHYTESIDEDLNRHDIILHKHSVKLQKNYMMLVHDTDCKTDIADHLYAAGVLNTEDIEDICNSSLTRQESNRILCNKLFRKGEDAYKHLLEALEHGQHDGLASALEKTQVPEHDIQMCQIGMMKLRERQKEKDFRVIHAKIEELARTQDEVIPKIYLSSLNDA